MSRSCIFMLIVCAACIPRFIHAAEPPNIVLILADDLVVQVSHRAVHIPLKSALSQWRKLVAARMPEPNINYNPERATELSTPNKGKNRN